MRTRRSGLPALLALLCAVPAIAGVTVEESRVLDRWNLRLGGYLTGLDTNIRLDSPISGEGTRVSFEDDLGFSSSETVPRLRLGVILKNRHQILVGWYETDRDSSTVLTREIEWGDETFPVDTEVGAFYKTEFFEVAYTYWYYSSEKTAFGVTGGLVLAELSAGLGVRLLGQGVAVTRDLKSETPVPQLGLAVSTYLGRRFILNGHLTYIDFNLEEWEGSVLGGVVGIEHRTWKNFGFGVGYAYSNYDITSTDLTFLGEFEYTIGGFELFGRATW